MSVPLNTALGKRLISIALINAVPEAGDWNLKICHAFHAAMIDLAYCPENFQHQLPLAFNRWVVFYVEIFR